MQYLKHTFLCAAIAAIVHILFANSLFAQWGFKVGEENKTPSTDTWNFVKHGEIGASLHTGTVNLSIPIHTYQDNDFTIPVSVSYSSNGYVANVRPGILGPDWGLDVGGRICVEIHGMQDFTYGQNVKSYYLFHQLANPGIEGTYWRYSNYADQNIELGAPAPEIIYIPEPGKNIYSTADKYDAEPDFFHFNFMGYSGSFHLGTNNNVYVYNTNGDNKLHKIEFTSSSNANIVITDKQGYKYEFSYFDGDRAQDRSGEAKLRISYNLTEITAPNGRTVSFTYESYDMTTYRPATYANTGGVIDLSDNNNPVSNTIHYSDQRVLESKIESQILTGIRVDNRQMFEFTYLDLPVGSKDQHKVNTGSTLYEFYECKRLSSIKALNPFSTTSPIIRQADFTYGCTGAPRINYLSSLAITGEGTYSFAYYGMPNGNIPPIGTFSVDHWGYYNGKTVGNFLKIVNTNTSTLDETLSNATRNHDAIFAINGMLKRITYPTGGYSEMEYEAHTYGKAFRRNSGNYFTPTLMTENGSCGGLRIKSVSNHIEDGTQINKKTYSYTLSNGQSSGILLYFPKYWITYSAQAGSYIESNIHYWSNNLICHNGSHIEYSSVTQTNSDGSKEVFHFSNSAMSYKYRDAIEVNDIVNEVTPSYGEWGITSNPIIMDIVAPYVSKKAERGKLLKHQIYAAGESTPVKETTYTYDTTRALTTDTYTVYLIRKFGKVPVYTDNWRLVSKTETEYNNGRALSRTETYTYNAMGQMSSVTITSSGGTVETVRYTYPSDHQSEGGIYTTMLNSNLHAYLISESRYIKENGIEKQTSGKKCSYAIVNNMVKPYATYNYNPTSQIWEMETRYTLYDAFGNLLESYDGNNIPTSYIWGYNGLYLVGKAENTPRSALASYITTAPLADEVPDATAASINGSGNIMLTTYHYNPLVGLTKVRYPNGATESYTYNQTGKLLEILNTLGNTMGSKYYSPDNKQ